MNFDELVRDEQEALTRRLAFVLGDRDAAQDARQEVLLRAWRSLPRDADAAHQRAWLKRAASHAAIDELRRRHRRAEVELDEAAGLGSDGVGEPDAARAALAALSAHDRFLLLLRFEGGFAHSEIAQLLEVSEEAARKRVARARAAFVEAYRRERRDAQPLILLVVYNQSAEPYVQWLQDAGARVRASGAPPGERALSLADGLVLSGAFDDIDPALYGQERRSIRGAADARHDRAQLAAIIGALALDLPYVGVCRGHQLLNIATGGSLYQDVVLDRATASSHDLARHGLQTIGQSTARAVVGSAAEVHSEHHQAIDRLGRKLRITATSPDGLAETVERTDRTFALGLQWHPEIDRGVAGDRVAEALVDAASRRAA